MDKTKKTLILINKIEVLLSQLGARDKSSSGQRIFGQKKVSDVKHKLSNSLVKKLRWIYTIRNKVVHEVDYEFKDFKHYVSECEKTILKLERIIEEESSKPSELKVSYFLIISLTLVLFLSLWYLFSDEKFDEEKRIELIENTEKINSLNEVLNYKTLRLETLSNEQGFLRSLINDTEEIDLIEGEIEQLTNKIDELSQINEDLKQQITF